MCSSMHSCYVWTEKFSLLAKRLWYNRFLYQILDLSYCQKVQSNISMSFGSKLKSGYVLKESDYLTNIAWSNSSAFYNYAEDAIRNWCPVKRYPILFIQICTYIGSLLHKPHATETGTVSHDLCKELPCSPTRDTPFHVLSFTFQSYVKINFWTCTCWYVRDEKNSAI
jgi:hypothetical protein